MYYYHIIIMIISSLVFSAISVGPKYLYLQIFFCFFKGEVGKGLKLIQEAVDLRKELGVPLYVAAGYCDLGSEYLLPPL